MASLILDLAHTLRRSGIPVASSEVQDCMQALELFSGEPLAAKQLYTLLNATLIKTEWGEALAERLADLLLGPEDERTVEALTRDLGQSSTGEGQGHGAGPAPIAQLLAALLAQDMDSIHAFCRTLRLSDLVDDRAEALARLERESGWAEVAAQVAQRALCPELQAKVQHLLEDWRLLLEAEVERAFAQSRGRAFVAMQLRQENPRYFSFATASGDQVARIGRELERLARRLATRKGRRRRVAKSGRIYLRGCFRRIATSGGVPLWLSRTRPRPARPELWLLCDMSNSVRQFSCFMLMFVAILQRRFTRVRSFAFVDRLLEITDLLGQEDLHRVRLRGHDLTGYSHYGEVLRQFHVEHMADLNRKATVIILGDGRNNWNPLDSRELLPEIREAVHALYWLNPLPQAAWSQGDSLMESYAPGCTAAYACGNLAELERLASVVF